MTAAIARANLDKLRNDWCSTNVQQMHLIGATAQAWKAHIFFSPFPQAVLNTEAVHSKVRGPFAVLVLTEEPCMRIKPRLSTATPPPLLSHSTS